MSGGNTFFLQGTNSSQPQLLGGREQKEFGFAGKEGTF